MRERYLPASQPPVSVAARSTSGWTTVFGVGPGEAADLATGKSDEAPLASGALIVLGAGPVPQVARRSRNAARSPVACAATPATSVPAVEPCSPAGGGTPGFPLGEEIREGAVYSLLARGFVRLGDRLGSINGCCRCHQSAAYAHKQHCTLHTFFSSRSLQAHLKALCGLIVINSLNWLSLIPTKSRLSMRRAIIPCCMDQVHTCF